MDYLYSSSLLVSLIAGSSGLIFGTLMWFRPGLRRSLSSASQFAVLVAAISLVVSVVIHWRFGHSVVSPEPMTPETFAGAHPAFWVAGLMVIASLALVWRKR